MATTQVFEQAVHTRLVAVSVIDALLQALRTAGEFPPPLGDVTCRVVEQTAPVARTFDPPLLLVTLRNSSGFLMLDGSWAHEDTPGRPLPLAPGTYTIRISGDYYQDVEFSLAWPPPPDQPRVPLDPQPPHGPQNILLLPGSAYPLPDVTLERLQLGPTILRGSLFSPAGEPLAGVPVELLNVQFLPPANLPPDLPPLGPWPFLKATSDERGGWTLVLPGRRYYDATPEVPPLNSPPITRQFTIRIHYPNAPALDLIENVQLGTEHPVPNTALRGQVVGPGGSPVSGAVITTSVSGVASVTRANGIWFLYFPLDQADVPAVTVTATTPSGASASDSTALVRHGATTFVPTFHFA